MTTSLLQSENSELVGEKKPLSPKKEKEKDQKANFPPIWVGDTVKIGVLIPEEKEEEKEKKKERLQFFEGVVLAIKEKKGKKSLRLRKLSQGIGIEKVFFLDCPTLRSVERKKRTKVRRAKLYFLRDLGRSKKGKDQSWKLKEENLKK